MPQVSTSWLVGYVVLPAQAWTFDGQAASLAAGTYALRHATGAISLIDAFDASNAAAATAITSTTTIKRNRIVRSVFSSAAALNWGSATLLRDVLGYAGNLASGTTHDADEISPQLWSPGYPATPKTIAGVTGYTVPHQARYSSDDGTESTTVHYSASTRQELSWQHIVPSRMRVTPSVGGTFHEFFESVLMLGRRFLHYELIGEDTASTSNVTWTTALGPYVLRNVDGDWYRRNVATQEVSSPLELALQAVSEVS